MIKHNMSITNLLNINQIELVGSLSTDRLIMYEVEVLVPNKKEQ